MKNHKVGITASTFDLLHSGHVAMLREAKTACDYLICALQNDPSVDRPNKNKPIQNIVERQAQLSGIRYVDEILVYNTEDELRDIVQQAVPTIRYFKNKFNRSRPFELDGNLDVLGSTTNKTRSYPSGHSTQAMIVALYVAQKFPEHKDGLMEAAKEVGMGRVKAGFHFLSDHVAGQMLGTKMFEHMNKEDYGQSLKEYYLLGTPEYDEYLRNLTPGQSVKEKLNQWDELDEDAEYQGKKVKLNLSLIHI